MKIAIYDEKKEFNNNVFKILKIICKKEKIIINKFLDKEKLLDSIKKEKYEIIFMDADKNYFINENNEILLEISRKIKTLKKNIQILFFSLYRKKIFHENEIKNLEIIANNNKKNFFIIQKKNNYKVININEILYFKYKKKSIIVTTKVQEIELCCKTNYLENIFEKNFFIKCNKEFLINPIYINNITKEFIYLKNNYKIPLNLSITENIKSKFALYLVNRYHMLNSF